MSYRRAIQIFLSAVLLFSFPAAAFAESVQGRVASTGSSSMDLTVYDTQGRPYPNALHLRTDSETRFSGVSSVRQLKKNDPVLADVSQRSGAWFADSINRLQEAQAVNPPTSAPSPSLSDTLRNPVVRGGITGAITGAVASGASGGKAGKGALIGAGVGAAGGLLEGLFSQNSQQRSVTSEEDQRR